MLIRSMMVAALMVAGQASAQEVWLSPGGISWHQDRAAGYRERNAGVVVELRHGDHAVMAGQYRNSFNRDSKLLGYRYTFARWGNFGAGGTIGLVDNYPARDGAITPYAAPVAFWEAGPVNLSLVAIPPVTKHISGWVFGLTASVRVW